MSKIKSLNEQYGHLPYPTIINGIIWPGNFSAKIIRDETCHLEKYFLLHLVFSNESYLSAMVDMNGFSPMRKLKKFIQWEIWIVT